MYVTLYCTGGFSVKLAVLLSITRHLPYIALLMLPCLSRLTFALNVKVKFKIFEGCKFCKFCCFPQNTKIITAKMNGWLVMWLQIMLAICKIYFE